MEKVELPELPQVYMEGGKLAVVLCAVKTNTVEGVEDSGNVQILLIETEL